MERMLFFDTVLLEQK